MAAARISVPDWNQSLIAKAVGLEPKSVSVRVDDDRSICFIDHKSKPRRELIVDKTTGKVTVA